MSSAGDLTARARIRDAAIRLFAERGLDGATVRDIAQEADVSSGLLRHHFGSKEGLRDACDEYALHELTALGIQFGDMSAVFARISAATLLLQRYLLQSTLDGSPAGNALFDKMVDWGEQWVEAAGIKVPDPRAYVALLSVMKMSMFTMREQLSRVLGEDVGEPDGWLRIVRASVEVFGTVLITPEQADQLRELVDRMRAEMSQDNALTTEEEQQ